MVLHKLIVKLCTQGVGAVTRIGVRSRQGWETFWRTREGREHKEGRERGTRIKRRSNVRNPDAASDTFSAY